MNKTTQKYFINLFVRKKKIIALYTFILFMGFEFLLLSDIITNRGENMNEITSISFILMLITLGVLGAILPLFTFKFSFVKKNVDTYFSIPINRNHLFKAHFIAPIIGTIIPILINYLIGGLILIPQNGIDVYFKLLILLIMAFGLFIAIYSINTFFILKCNNILDASIITVAVATVPLLLYGATSSFVYSQIVRTGMVDNVISNIPQIVIDLLCPYSGLAIVGSPIDVYSNHTITVDFNNLDFALYVYYIVVGIIFAIQAKLTFKKKKGEDAEQLSTHFLTYPLLSNTALFALILMFNFTEYNLTAAILIMVALFVVYMIINGIANRSMKINARMIIKFIVLFVLVNGFNIISKETEFFGYNRKVLDYTKYEEVTFIYSNYTHDKDEEYISVRVIVENCSDDEKQLFEYLKEIQKEKSLAFKENDYDRLYPYEDGNYNLQIDYDWDVEVRDENDEYVNYQLNKQQADHVKMLMDKLNKTNDMMEVE